LQQTKAFLSKGEINIFSNRFIAFQIK